MQRRAHAMQSAEIPRKQFPSSILVANVTRMSLTCHKKIGRVGRVGRGCYEETAAVEFRRNSAFTHTLRWDETGWDGTGRDEMGWDGLLW